MQKWRVLGLCLLRNKGMNEIGLQLADKPGGKI
jgi:hypothetical protein